MTDDIPSIELADAIQLLTDRAREAGKVKFRVGDLVYEVDWTSPAVETPKPGEQPLPTGDGACVQDAFLNHWIDGPEDLERYLIQRKHLGIRRYGKPLQVDNGRDALTDAFEEAFDLVMYLGQAAMEKYGELPTECYPEDPTAPVDPILALLDTSIATLMGLRRMLIARDGQLPAVPES